MTSKKPLQVELGLDLLGPISSYIEENQNAYIEKAVRIKPDLNSPFDVWTRITFSILSANTPFDTSVRGLQYATACYMEDKDLDGFALTHLGAMTANKADWINALSRDTAILTLTKKDGEGWHAYRMRLKDSVKGLGLAKATFAACLLYPDEADLACIDTWIQKVFLGRTGWKALGLKDYISVENRIREIAREKGIGTFITQWLIWDYRRGSQTSHDIFPGSHKIEDTIYVL